MFKILNRIDLFWNILTVRYIANGLVATAVHFSVLEFNLIILDMTSAGKANFIAAIVGILVSFLGSRYLVFKAFQRPLMQQLIKFAILYSCIAILHGLIIYAWSDINGWDYRIGFLLATLLQLIISFRGNSLIVFKK